MPRHLGQTELLHGESGQYVPADVFLGFSDKNISDFEKLWRPSLDAAVREARRVSTTLATGVTDRNQFLAELARLRVEDAGWRWPEIAASIQGDDRYLGVAIECEGETQGLMLVEAEDHVTRLPEKGQGLAYVELVAVAPSNRPTLQHPPNFQFVGQSLIATAISLSIELKYEGRIALHSVPGAEAFYRKCGMTSMGRDPMKGGYLYFEMTSEQSSGYLARE
jgi:hypothetical protein